MDKVHIFIAVHKECTVLKGKGYIPIQVGRARTGLCLDMPGDDTGDNISERNDQFCELTAQYWAWKNDDAEIKGLNHYRRYFVDKSLCYLTEEEILKILEQHEAILPYPVYKTKINDFLYRRNPDKSSKRLIALRSVLAVNHEKYLKAFDHYAYGYRQSFSNMLIARRDVFDRYSAWMFNVLEEYEALVGSDQLGPRELGFVGEYLLNVWMDTNNVDTVFYRTFNTESRRYSPMRTVFTDFLTGIGLYDVFCWCWHILDRVKDRY